MLEHIIKQIKYTHTHIYANSKPKLSVSKGDQFFQVPGAEGFPNTWDFQY